jgi:putative tryptophan/tyrosine transport system substrate-binding protein
MRRREFISLLGGVVSALPMTAGAQQAARVWRIGMLETTGEAAKPADIAAFRQGLSQLGYTEGKNLIIDYRSADGRPERFPALAAEFVGRNCDLIVTRGTICVESGWNCSRRWRPTLRTQQFSAMPALLPGSANSLSFKLRRHWLA